MSRPKYDTPEKLQTYLDEFFRNNPTQNFTHLGDIRAKWREPNYKTIPKNKK